MAWEIVTAFFIILGIIIGGIYALFFVAMVISYPFVCIGEWCERFKQVRRERGFQKELGRNPYLRELYEEDLVHSWSWEPEPSWFERVLQKEIRVAYTLGRICRPVAKMLGYLPKQK